jgi:hypothetical protein
LILANRIAFEAGICDRCSVTSFLHEVPGNL